MIVHVLDQKVSAFVVALMQNICVPRIVESLVIQKSASARAIYLYHSDLRSVVIGG